MKLHGEQYVSVLYSFCSYDVLWALKEKNDSGLISSLWTQMWYCVAFFFVVNICYGGRLKLGQFQMYCLRTIVGGNLELILKYLSIIPVIILM